MKTILLFFTLLLTASGLARAQAPTTLFISKTTYGGAISGNLAMTPTTRPAGTTAQRITFMMRGTDFFYGGRLDGVAHQWYPNYHQLWVVIRGSGVADGRGIMIGTLSELAYTSPSSGACAMPAMVQSVLFASSLRLFPTTCTRDSLRLVDDRWYRFVVDVTEAKGLYYSIAEVTSTGTVLQTLVTNTHVSAVPLTGSPDAPISGNGVGIAAANNPNGSPFSVEIKNITVSWF